MARARNIKPAFFKNDQLAELPFEYRLLYIGLWTMADREGRLEDRPKRIRMEIFPADNVDCDLGIQALHDAGFVIRYAVDDLPLLEIPRFLDHQSPHHKEVASTLPPRVQASSMPVIAPGSSAKHEAQAPDKHSPDRGCEGGSTALNPDVLNPDTGFRKPPATKKPAVVPPWLLPDLWQRWCDFRKAKSGKGWTADAQALSLRTLSKLRDAGHEPAAVIDQSIEAGWTGLFEPKATRGATGTGSSKPWEH